MKVKVLGKVVKSAAAHWAKDNAARLGAALSYYTLFAIPPLFVILIYVASLCLDEKTVRTGLFSQVGGLIGEKGADAIQSALSTSNPHGKGLVASVLALATLILTATGFFIELQGALNAIWKVEQKPGQGIMGFIKTRLMSFAVLVGIGFLLMVSLVASAALSAAASYFARHMPGLKVLGIVFSLLLAFAVITVLFGMIFKTLPDVQMAWRDVWMGAAFTAGLFTGGKFLLGLYLAHNSSVTAYGAAGSIVLILLWVYYSAQILFFGAELTKSYADCCGTKLIPKPHAQWVQCEKPEAMGAQKQEEPRSKRNAELLSELREEVDSLRSVVRSRHEKRV